MYIYQRYPRHINLEDGKFIEVKGPVQEKIELDKLGRDVDDDLKVRLKALLDEKEEKKEPKKDKIEEKKQEAKPKKKVVKKKVRKRNPQVEVSDKKEG